MPLRELYPNSETQNTLVDKDDRDHAWDTWRKPSGPNGKLWLRDTLPSILPESRIFLYEYNSSAVYGSNRGTFIDKANELLEALRIDREDVEERPLIFLGHSLGGLLIEQALVNAHNNPVYTPIKNATSGLAFFGTPHSGGNALLVTIGGIATKISSALGFQKGDDVLETLKSGSIFTDVLREHWRQQLLQYHIISFWGSQDNIVPRESARFQLPGDRENIVMLNSDHSGICRFDDSPLDQDNFKIVRYNIKDLYKKATEAERQARN